MDDLCRPEAHAPQCSIGTILLDICRSSWSRRFISDLEAAFPNNPLFPLPQDEGFELGHLLRRKPAYLIMDACSVRTGSRRLQSRYAALCHALPGMGVVLIVDAVHDGDLLRLVSLDLRGVLLRSDTNEQSIAALRSIFFGYVLIKRFGTLGPTHMGNDNLLDEEESHQVHLTDYNLLDEEESHQVHLTDYKNPHYVMSAGEVEHLYLPPTPNVRRLSILSQKEREIVRLVSIGYGSRVIGHLMSLSEGRVKNILTEIYLKLGVSSRKELTALVLHERD